MTKYILKILPTVKHLNKFINLILKYNSKNRMQYHNILIVFCFTFLGKKEVGFLVKRIQVY